MSEREARLAVVDLLAEHELALARLYEAYARAEVESGEFWSQLAEEEKEHARWIGELKRAVEEDAVGFDRGRFSVESVKTSLGYVEEEVARAEAGARSLVEALSKAMDLENALIERRFFEVFDGDAEPVRRVLRRLSEGTFAHRERLAAAWEKARGD
jgi:hypothetical protein